MKNIDYSVVIPIFNEEEIIPELWRQLLDVLQRLDGNSEVIFINDGSVDSSFELLKKITQQHLEVKIINFSRNFGHQSALSAGIDHADGKAVILMDGDLQDSPEAIISFSRLWQQGYDVVYAIRKNRKEKLLKRLAFKSFYYIQRKLSGIITPMDAGIFSLMDRKVILTLRQMPERNKYLSGLRAYAGFKQIGISVERGPRYRGEPKVSVSKLFKLAFDGIFSFSTIPLKMATILGLVSAIFSFIIGLIGLYFKFVLGQEFLSWAYGLTTTFFMGGIQLLSLGIIGEYIGRIYDEVRQRPYYIIREKIGFEKISSDES
ncbi:MULTISPECIES: glycosyltransferase family 2 protein [Okeania]|uniref:Glycosyltransferase n=1 Tax=Okeania hirsuta TaxID=1458930 RepID=A0A3N6PJ47_9CYAN|nr:MULTISPECIES: glycosyltransferase family 2 protein [Okeania]NEP39713.1 glycosyltransferase [Okeania sp. SIO2H7]NEP72981.1 glycosyltransferase [Okeania sp. SIO2G5]NEP95532.1 glycosyltransferase [Okeania sp. SIO2F5]NEQ92345.1 glycosyltransferase [Okeania sp. SIO2G4]NES77393.1 glycosyltransferase [Okeania sp. SIO1H4]